MPLRRQQTIVQRRRAAPATPCAPLRPALKRRSPPAASTRFILLFGDTPLLQTGDDRGAARRAPQVRRRGHRGRRHAPGRSRPLTAALCWTRRRARLRDRRGARRRARSSRSPCATAASWRSTPTRLALVDRIGNDNAKREFYLTDIVGIARGRASPAASSNCRPRGARRQHPRRAGRGRGPDAAPPAPPRAGGGAHADRAETVFLAADTRSAATSWSSRIVVFGPGVRSTTTPHPPFSHLEAPRSRPAPSSARSPGCGPGP